MKKRQIIIIGTAVLVLVIGKLISNVLAEPAEKRAKAKANNVAVVFTETVKNDTIPVYFTTTGSLEAVRRMELFSEVQGVMKSDNGKFKAGNTFQKGETLIEIQSTDQDAQLYAQRSSFESAITSIMPDIKSDFPNDFSAWKTYLTNYAVNERVKPLPNVSDEKLQSFLVGRSIYSSYHILKNLELINEKYAIKAPYNGVLTEANADPGTVIRPGQSLGVFIQPNLYELEASTDAVTAQRLKVGQLVTLTMDGLEGKEWVGEISRIVKAIDKASQLNTFFVRVEGEELKEGMFLQAKVRAEEILNAFELSRSALVDNNKVYLVKDDKLVLTGIQNQFFNQDDVVITGLSDGDRVLTKVPPSAFEGMNVTIYKEQ